MKNIVLGICAHVDAGKTTLSEALLYCAGAINKPGRVDRRDSYLDTNSLEKERGITIFSSQAQIDLENTHVTLIDTPGHVDFSCETERAMWVQDYAILLISATDGVTSHTKTLWNLLEERKIPTFIFINKTDISTRISRELVDEVKTVLSKKCVNFTHDDTDEFYEEVAGCEEGLISEYFATDRLTEQSISEAIARRDVFPVYLGSALKLIGIDGLIYGLNKYTITTPYSKSLFGARIYKIKYQ